MEPRGDSGSRTAAGASEVGDPAVRGSVDLSEAVKSVDFSFPAGLIPHLIARCQDEALTRSEIQREVEALSTAESSERDDKAMAEKLRDYYADLRDTLSQSFLPDGRPRAAVPSPEVGTSGDSDDDDNDDDDEAREDRGPALLDDRAGLGMKIEATDAYSAYREKKSGAYHSKIVNWKKKRHKRR